MGRKSIVGRLPVVYDPARRGFAVENSAEFVKTQIRQKLDELAHGKPLRLTVTFELERKGRSINQNRMMWALLTIMADAYNAGRAGGIQPEDLHHIFKRFYRSRFSKDKQGIGLGLPLAKMIVESHNGTIEVDSTLGAGTTFTLSFLIPTKL